MAEEQREQESEVEEYNIMTGRLRKTNESYIITSRRTQIIRVDQSKKRKRKGRKKGIKSTMLNKIKIGRRR